MTLATPNAAAQIEQLLRQRFQPLHLAVRDDSHAHVGHHSAGGKGHFHVTVVSTSFEGLRPLQRHRLVNDALSPLFDTIIHALAIETLTPREFKK
ncbi:MAG TPA: BolA family protein [Steroidobacteraceae bacterium]|jgi:BolA protein|nr:BolA family protein [Steroidobacteraceae bacterium]